MLASLSLLLEGDGVTLETLRFTSCQAPVAEAFCADVARHVGEQLGVATTVLDLLIARDFSLESRLRVIEVFGPSPIPPWVISKTVPPAVRAAVRSALLSMSDDARGRAVLASGRVARFVRVSDTDYDPIRSMSKAADRVQI